ncbi:hypothetical protein N7520_008029 [Penicillium odoratum]|uniref:uncharacterized protein n=1 Tax=Penicillium odoratum TaxID=1167516 RepID=UPI002548353A|nr:uncharacterized protein N7520_008029 [Penicillium odoratum]KAJ5760873.1 hypothetical protein N7520_008029 [Penicillium odoratum]
MDVDAFKVDAEETETETETEAREAKKYKRAWIHIVWGLFLFALAVVIISLATIARTELGSDDTTACFIMFGEGIISAFCITFGINEIYKVFRQKREAFEPAESLPV